MAQLFAAPLPPLRQDLLREVLRGEGPVPPHGVRRPGPAVRRLPRPHQGRGGVLRQRVEAPL